jgi:hypothetical protein
LVAPLQKEKFQIPRQLRVIGRGTSMTGITLTTND